MYSGWENDNVEKTKKGIDSLFYLWHKSNLMKFSTRNMKSID